MISPGSADSVQQMKSCLTGFEELIPQEEKVL